MPPQLREWNDSPTPVVEMLEYYEDRLWKNETIWHEPYVCNLSVGNTVRVRIRMCSREGTRSHQRMRAWVERVGFQNEVLETIAFLEEWRNEEYDVTKIVDIPLTGQILRLQIRTQHFHAFSSGGESWDDPESRLYTALIQFYGSFALDYVPITILYCPPGQDMTNEVEQTSEYGTVVTLGTSELVGSSVQTSSQVRGGVTVTTPYYQAGAAATEGEGAGGSQSTENGARNSIGFSYAWKTRLIADNQRAIGRAYWGPMSDLFVLLHNPWFGVSGDGKGITLTVDPRTSDRTEILVVSAHKLLRPDGDPVASRIPADTRKRILQLDPFLANLDDFLPVDSGQPLAHAANPLADPSIGTGGSYQGTNRAALIARYGISTGVELDLTATTAIDVADCETNETVYECHVEESFGVDGVLNLLGGLFSLTASSTTATGSSVRVSYQKSREVRSRLITTAKCFLIRNQNAVDLNDLELWYDKQFSTFMFRPWYRWRPVVVGGVHGPAGQVLANAMVTLVSVELASKQTKRDSKGPASMERRSYATMTDHAGRFRIPNIALPGVYELTCGDQTKLATLTPADAEAGRTLEVDIKNARRTLNLRQSAAWELGRELGLDAPRTRSLQAAIRKADRLDAASFNALLKEHDIPVDPLAQRVHIEYELPKRPRSEHS